MYPVFVKLSQMPTGCNQIRTFYIEPILHLPKFHISLRLMRDALSTAYRPLRGVTLIEISAILAVPGIIIAGLHLDPA